MRYVTVQSEVKYTVTGLDIFTIQRDIVMKVKSLHVIYPLFLSDLNET